MSQVNSQHLQQNKPSLLSDFLAVLFKMLSQINFLFQNFERESLVLDVIFFNFLKNFFVKLNTAFIKILERNQRTNAENTLYNENDNTMDEADRSGTNSYVQSEKSLELSGNNSVEVKSDDSDKLVEEESGRGTKLQQKMMEACYDDISKLMMQLDIFDDYQTEIKSALKMSKKYIPKLIKAKNEGELNEMAEDFAVEEELEEEIKVIKNLLKNKNI